MKVNFNTAKFDKDMKNFIDYSIGFLEGAHDAKPAFFKEFGRGTIAALNQYIDSHARMNQQSLHHVYEWYQTGSPDARLFKITSMSTTSGFQVTSKFTQSKTIANNSTKPFANKASVMENGMPVHIKPTKGVLAFDVNGETVFTKKEVTVSNPGGTAVRGSYQQAFDSFFKNYFSQSFLRSSGLLAHLEDVSIYKDNIKYGITNGRSVGKTAGYRWLMNAKVGIE